MIASNPDLCILFTSFKYVTPSIFDLQVHFLLANYCKVIEDMCKLKVFLLLWSIFDTEDD